MNKLELLIYNLVKDNPVLKQRIVDLYQAALGLVPQRALVCDQPHQVRSGYFYGFHDKSPFSADGLRLLAHRNLVGDRSVRAGDAAEVGVFAGKDWMDFTPLGRTNAWNWQLGSMLQWCGAEQVVFNTLVDGQPRARVVDLRARPVADWPYPVVARQPRRTLCEQLRLPAGGGDDAWLRRSCGPAAARRCRPQPVSHLPHRRRPGQLRAVAARSGGHRTAPVDGRCVPLLPPCAVQPGQPAQLLPAPLGRRQPAPLDADVLGRRGWQRPVPVPDGRDGVAHHLVRRPACVCLCQAAGRGRRLLPHRRPHRPLHPPLRAGAQYPTVIPPTTCAAAW